MKKIVQGLSIAVFLLTFTISLGTAFAAQTTETGLIDESADKSSTASSQNSEGISDTEKKYLIEESAYHRFFKRAKGNLTLLGQRLSFVFSNYSKAPSEVVKALYHLTGGKGFGYLIKIFLLFLLTVAIAFGVEKLLNIPMKKIKQQLQSTVSQSFIQLIARLSARTALELVSLAVFALTIVGLHLLFYPLQSPLYEVAMVYLPPIFIIRISYIVLNLLYSPTAPHMRVAPQNCKSAAMYFFGFMAFVIFSLLITKTLLLLKSHGMSEGVFLLFYSHLGMLQFVILVTILWSDRARITRSIMKDQKAVQSQTPAFADKIQPLWFPLACAALLGFELLWQTNLLLFKKDLVLPLLLTILSIPFGFLLFFVGNRLLLIASGQIELLDPRIVNRDILPEGADISAFVNIVLPPEPAAGKHPEGSDQKESVIRRHLSLIQNLMGIIIACALVFWVMNLWGLDLPLGRAFVRSILSISATFLLAYAIWEICRTIIDRKLEQDRPQSEKDVEDVEGGTGGSRKGTLLTLLRKFILTLIAVMVILITLNAVGINIGPLLAGAGILGLALGFGSQTLVRDILSGVFYLLDDAFRVGDYIETAGTKGMVEQISLRAVKLRHPRGMVFTIPFGDMGSVQNFSRDYIITKLDIRVRYDTDIDRIRKIVKKINKELEKDEDIGPVLLSKIKSQGVKEMGDSAMVLRVKYKTKPGEQFVVRRELYKRIQESFKQNGIEFAHRNVTVYLPPEVTGAADGENRGENTAPGGTLDKKLLEAGAAAAIAASHAEELEKKPGK